MSTLFNEQKKDGLALHAEISADVRDVEWSSNCAGEVFAEDGSEHGLRIGHFQGDATIAAFLVAVHNEYFQRASARG